MSRDSDSNIKVPPGKLDEAVLDGAVDESPPQAPLDESFLKEPSDAEIRAYIVKNLVMLAVVVVGFVVLAWLLQRFFGTQLAAASRYLTDTVGYPGVFFAIFTIDTFTLPIAPDFVLAFVAHDGSTLYTPLALAFICLGSILGGNAAYWLAGKMGKARWVQRLLSSSYRMGNALFRRYGVWTVVIAGLTPVPFSIICWLAGLYQMDRWSFFLATLSRVPRFIGWYYLIRLGFSL